MNQPNSNSIVQAFYAAVNAKDVVQAACFLSEDVHFATLTGDLLGKPDVCRYLQALIAEEITFEIRPLVTQSNQVQYAYTILANGQPIDTGEDGLARLHNGLIIFDGTGTITSIQEKSS